MDKLKAGCTQFSGPCLLLLHSDDILEVTANINRVLTLKASYHLILQATHEVCAIKMPILQMTKQRHRMVKSHSQRNNGARAEPRHSGSKAYVLDHHIMLPLNLLYQRPILVWIPTIADPKTRF